MKATIEWGVGAIVTLGFGFLVLDVLRLAHDVWMDHTEKDE